MEHIDPNKTIQTHDIALATALLTCEHPLVAINRTNKFRTGRSIFILGRKNNTDDIVRDFEMDKLSGKLRSYASNFKYLKSKLNDVIE